MSRVLLVSYPGYPSTPAHLVANHWLAGNAGALLAAGHEVRVVDFGTVSMMRRLFPEQITTQLKPLAAEMMSGTRGPDTAQLARLQEWSHAIEAHQSETVEQLARELVTHARGWQPDVVAFELSDGDGYRGSVHMARRLRDALPDVHITAGGRKAAWFRVLLLRASSAFDTIIYGDPEPALTGLAGLQAERSLESIPGIVYRTGEQTAETPRDDALDLDALAMPEYDTDVYPAMSGDGKIKMAVLTDSRGCPNRCAFCVHPMEDGGKQRLASPRRVVDTMQEMQQRWGMSVFRLGGSSTPGELMHQIAEEILRRGLRVQYNSFGHFRSSNSRHFETLARSGLYSLFFGLESGSQQILDRAVHKGIRLEAAAETIKAAQAAGIFAAASMIVPLPFDTEETLAESLEFVKRVRPDAVPLQFPGVFPGTRWIEEPEKYGIEIDDVEQYLLDNLDYRVKLLFPPQFWDPLPYRINGMDFARLTAVTMRFAGQLEAAGLLTNLSHTLAAIARSADMEPRRLRDMSQLWCVTGDAESMGGMVARANVAMVEPGLCTPRSVSR